MKKYLIVAFLLASASAWAATSEFVVTSMTKLIHLKAARTIAVSYTAPVAIMTTAATCKVFLNASSATMNGHPMAANTWYKYQTTPDTTALQFRCYSSGGSAIYVVK